MTRLRRLTATGARIAAVAVLAAGGAGLAEGTARSVSGLTAMLSGAALQRAYHQDLALDERPEAAQLHLATYGWEGETSAPEPAICPQGESVDRLAKPLARPSGLGQPL